MNKGELIDAVARSTGESRSTVSAVVDGTLDAITGALKTGDKVTFTGFGTFERRATAARTGRNPQTGAAVDIAAGHRPAFKAGKGLKDAMK